MASRRNITNAAPLFQAAALSYAANCALGVAVAARLIDTRGFRWLHHALYITTCAAIAAALIAGWRGTPRRTSQEAALTLAPAVVPLVAIAYVPTHSRRHPLTALAAAPFIVASVMRSLRPADRK
jgi:TRAP-type C4-dicarboxylate transport system permease small subunit